ncbi:hypothetical protein, partial [uncultured Duncaniella sp.]|uniref:hypothetical protein n=1 Tax=uncultured Duncaniella sp. TaxID=2768039 RepID=UPI0026F3C696
AICVRDWSSDVCSSDLNLTLVGWGVPPPPSSPTIIPHLAPPKKFLLVGRGRAPTATVKKNNRRYPRL